MNNSSIIKNCPFCKNKIPAPSEKCPICKMILIEKIEIGKRIKHSSFPDKQTNDPQNNIKKKSDHNKIKLSKKDHISSALDFIKRRKVLTAFSFLTLILFCYFLQTQLKTNHADKVMYDNEFEKSNKKQTDKLISDYKPIPIEREKYDSIIAQMDGFSNLKPKEFITILENIFRMEKSFIRRKNILMDSAS